MGPGSSISPFHPVWKQILHTEHGHVGRQFWTAFHHVKAPSLALSLGLQDFGNLTKIPRFSRNPGWRIPGFLAYSFLILLIFQPVYGILKAYRIFQTYFKPITTLTPIFLAVSDLTELPLSPHTQQPLQLWIWVNSPSSTDPQGPSLSPHPSQC